jgi:hypothetical protein
MLLVMGVGTIPEMRPMMRNPGTSKSMHPTNKDMCLGYMMNLGFIPILKS